jgi:hypothetical protein
MRSGGRSSGGVSEQGRRIHQTHKREAANGPCVVSMTSLNLPERMNELSAGMIRPFNATSEGRRGSISEISVQLSIELDNAAEGAQGRRDVGSCSSLWIV